ncbi:hypothetical protein GLOTRDRAFT_117086 [Gloeophyllum trabeum ATCC 11539]|uniref:Autophagy-related protein 14 n=1 Tax=Gloeophyllum trabeum (strain ATCC 11539 / FP-39264 / Madison 617) TaxID=670483 RepID=S7RM51_GLOTA|nr:uncharacterized protein GLOTRDRAFT_117086 [Gloeophyllum trabeum ATCC 11539]EPQ53789.1 hypothetical protein GLOTRDRAFT_117086 [Gloeophyllum trabeum ATCC 11539]
MDCKNCELKARHFYCAECLRKHLLDFRRKTQHAAAERDEQVAKASRALHSVERARRRRADLAERQARVQQVSAALTKLRKENDKARERLRSLRESLATRRRNISAAKLLPVPALDPIISRESQELSALSDTLARARSGLVQELVEVFHVVEVGGRPPIGGKAGTKGEWTIGDLVLPVPGDIRRYPPDHINAVITHTIHFLGLLTFYLGIKLPFEVTWSGKKLGVGQPWIGATRGTDHGGWARWYSKQPLHLSSAPASTMGPTTSAPPISASMSESYVDAAASSQSSFTTAFAMLLYNVCYLAYTQSVDVPLSQAGDVLSNLWAVCCSSDLGRRSHETHPLLPPPTPPSFGLDFAQLLQATAARPVPRQRAKVHRSSTDTPRLVHKPQAIAEEEDGWDLIEDVEEGSFGG